MASLGEVYAALPAFRAQLQQGLIGSASPAPMAASAFRGAFSAFRTPLSNVHATGVGIRVRKGKVIPDEYVIKVYVFDKVDLGEDTPAITRGFGNVGVDVEDLPVQLALGRAAARRRPALRAVQQQAVTPPNRAKHRPIVGGVSIAPLGEAFVGTLGCFVQRRVTGIGQIFALSNNHVLADTNRLPSGTLIVQPGPETGPSTPTDAFAALSEFVPIRFPSGPFNRETNRFDAAIARVIDTSLIRQGSMLGIRNYDPEVAVPLPGMRVTKSGRTTGITSGQVTAVSVNGVQVNYGTPTNPIIATFNDTIQIVGDGGQPFSLPGNSGSAVLDVETGKPVALLFAGDGRTTTTCSFAGVCRHFQVAPV